MHRHPGDDAPGEVADPGPPPGRARSALGPGRWRSPVRGPWLTSVFGLVLLIGIPIEFLTGLASYAAYNPGFRSNDPNPKHGLFGLYLFDWLTSPGWVYRLTEGVHVMLGLALVPVVLAKLWSVMPKLFAWPRRPSVAQVLERASLILVVGGVAVEMTTGILNIDYLTTINFYSAHFFGAWAFIAGFVVHVCLKFGDMLTALRSRRLRTELRTGLAETRPEEADDGLVPLEPAAPTISRRGILALVGGTSLVVVLSNAGDTIGGFTRRFAVFGTHYRSNGPAGNDFPVNHTAAARRIAASQTGPDWRLVVTGTQRLSVSRTQLTSMRLTSAAMPIACTEGWSTTQTWTGVPLADLARLAGIERPGSARIESLDSLTVMLSAVQIGAADAMLALRVNGADLSPDHGFPARVMVPAAPGTHNLKWIKRIAFSEAS
ncbi:molybdopterin-dependent oxidoreductase [Mycobacterium paraense]|uniref:molybdopterin-dependent oxidoreductase n=1 Tax=Mycobacterium paraense TaxID=767916 RepID=UPI000A1513A7|nr:molybdopterin-dependent oxidoreductase [Mycobacterium paraense]MCV7443764.1 molybdopterin-dependent oxidoreductase [Mycobacterium paraense]